ncbi:MAG: hypothetical protein CM15mP117_20760 [Alphaproteobacteria bacterium]|nr:MAG: hypothetical protein CM15mP117_20760 [Alphaproteobacteria bacterium]
MRNILIVAYSILLGLFLTVGVNAQTIKNPGVLVHAADDEATTLDPAQVEAGEGGETVILQVYDRLLEFGPSGPELIPGLATTVPSVENGMISDDGMTYTFKIRKGAVFHDGTDVTAEDVKFSWDRIVEMDLPEGQAGVISDIVSETKVVDDYTFQVILLEPSASFLNSTVVSMAASIVSKDAVMANGGVVEGEPNEYMAQNAVGSGPYKLKAWNRGENILLDINENYWGNKAKLAARIEIGAEPDVRVLGLRAGNYDTIETDPSFVADIEGADGVTLHTGGLLLEPIHVGFNLNIPDGALQRKTQFLQISSMTREYAKLLITLLITKLFLWVLWLVLGNLIHIICQLVYLDMTQMRQDMGLRIRQKQKPCFVKPVTGIMAFQFL